MDKILSLSLIRKRKASLEAEMADLELRLSDIADDISELEEAETFVKRFGAERPDETSSPEQPENQLPFPTAKRAKTTKDALLLALKVSTEPWLTANELQVRATGLKGVDIPMATVSPTLSNLKNEGMILREGHKVALASRIKTTPPQSNIVSVEGDARSSDGGNG
jgi:hypothetical protein